MGEVPGAGDWAAVGAAVRERLREFGMSESALARETALPESAIRSILSGQPPVSLPGTASPELPRAEAGPLTEAAICDLPMPDDMDADYSPQYVKLARILRDKIASGELSQSTTLPVKSVAAGYRVSAPVAGAALEMLAVNRYVTRPEGTRYYRVTWDASHPHAQDQP